MNLPADQYATQHAPVQEVRGVLIQIAGAQLLLPNAATVEVLSYADPEPVPDAPDWLLGQIRWRGWRVPLVAYARLAGGARDTTGLGTKIVVLKALGGDPKLPYMAMVAQGFPRLVTVTGDNMIADSAHEEVLPDVVRARVLFNEDIALIPNLDAAEAQIVRALRPPVAAPAA
jgi:chemosensory pili system protein ChpC